VNTPKKILYITKRIKCDDFTDENKYIIKPPYKLLKEKLGICYDIVELERYYFSKMGYVFKTFFAYNQLHIEDNPAHTFLVYKEDSKYYWFESAWKTSEGIHGPFRSYKDSLLFVSKVLKQEYGSDTILEYSKFDYKGMNINQFENYVLNNGKHI
jgi:hypothetical protein